MDCSALPSGEEQPAPGLIDFAQDLTSSTTNSAGQA